MFKKYTRRETETTHDDSVTLTLEAAALNGLRQLRQQKQAKTLQRDEAIEAAKSILSDQGKSDNLDYPQAHLSGS